MKLYRNLSEIKRKESLGRRLSLVGLGVLFVGLLASFVPNLYPPTDPAPAGAIPNFLYHYWTWISFAALPAGFIFASFGSYFINRFARRRWPGIKTIARPDELLERSLKGFDDKYSYFAWSLPANYVVAGPCGVLVLAVRSDRGRVRVQGDRWREPFSLGRLFTVFAREGVGNPVVELEEQAKKVRALMSQSESSASLATVPTETAVVFLNPEMTLELDNPTITTLRADQLKEYVRRRAREARLTGQAVRDLNEFLAKNSRHEEVTEG